MYPISELELTIWRDDAAISKGTKILGSLVWLLPFITERSFGLINFTYPYEKLVINLEHNCKIL